MNNYQEIKNYIHNDLGITKEYINDIIQDTVKIEINKLFNDENKITSLLVKEINRAIHKENPNSMFYQILIGFDDLLKHEIQKTILDEVRSKLEIKLIDGGRNNDTSEE